MLGSEKVLEIVTNGKRNPPKSIIHLNSKAGAS